MFIATLSSRQGEYGFPHRGVTQIWRAKDRKGLCRVGRRIPSTGQASSNAYGEKQMNHEKVKKKYHQSDGCVEGGEKSLTALKPTLLGV